MKPEANSRESLVKKGPISSKRTRHISVLLKYFVLPLRPPEGMLFSADVFPRKLAEMAGDSLGRFDFLARLRNSHRCASCLLQIPAEPSA
jgi:hypothetical protein